MALRAPPMVQKIDPITGKLTYAMDFDPELQAKNARTLSAAKKFASRTSPLTSSLGPIQGGAQNLSGIRYGTRPNQIGFSTDAVSRAADTRFLDNLRTASNAARTASRVVPGLNIAAGLLDAAWPSRMGVAEDRPEWIGSENTPLYNFNPSWGLNPAQSSFGPTYQSATTATGGGLTDWDWRGLGLGVGGPVSKAYEATTGAYPGWYGNYAEAQKIAENLATKGLSTASVSDQRKGALASEHMNLGQKLAMGIPGIAPVIAGQIVDEKDASYGLQAGIDNTVGWFGGMPEGTQTDAYMGLVADALAENNPERLASLNASIPEMVDQMKQQVDTGYDYTPKQLMGIASAGKPYIPDQDISAFDYVAKYEEEKAAAVAARIEEQRIEAERVAQVLADAERARASERANRSQRQAEQAVVAAGPDPGLVAAQSRVVSAPPVAAAPRRKPPPRKTAKKTTKITRPKSTTRPARKPNLVWVGGLNGGIVDLNNPGMGDVAGPDRGGDAMFGEAWGGKGTATRGGRGGAF